MKSANSLGNVEGDEKLDPNLLKQLAKVMEILQNIED